MAAAMIDFRKRANDACTAFDAIGELFITGPTGANGSDFRTTLVGELPQ